jgi:hypothetical protein
VSEPIIDTYEWSDVQDPYSWKPSGGCANVGAETAQAIERYWLLLPSTKLRTRTK